MSFRTLRHALFPKPVAHDFFAVSCNKTALELRRFGQHMAKPRIDTQRWQREGWSQHKLMIGLGFASIEKTFPDSTKSR